jgi:hypothetical protein
VTVFVHHQASTYCQESHDMHMRLPRVQLVRTLLGCENCACGQ